MLRRALVRTAEQLSDVVIDAAATADEVRERLASSEPYDLVVCDYRMRSAQSTSAPLVRELLARGVNVALMTGYAASLPRDLAGKVPTVEKPFTLEDILALLGR